MYRWDGTKARHFNHIEGDTSSLPYDIIISILFEDEYQSLWISTLGRGLAIYDKSSGRFSGNPLNVKNKPEITDLKWVKWAAKDTNGILWGIGGTDIFFRYDLKTGECDFLLPEPLDKSSPANEVSALLYDSVNGIFWTGTKAGLFKYSISENRFFAISKSKKSGTSDINCIVEEQPGVLWIGTSTGLFQYNDYANSWEFFSTDSGDSVNIQDIFQNPLDRNKSLWITTESDIKKFNKKKKTFTHYSIKYQGRRFTTTQFVAWSKGSFLDENGFLWMSTDNLGAAVINLNENPFRQYRVGLNKTEQDKNGATAFHLDDSGNLWIGTGFNGLYRYDQNMLPVTRYRNSPENNNSLSHNFVQTILKGADGSLWVGTEDGLNRLNKNSGNFQHFIDQPLEFEGGLDFVRIAHLYRDSTGRLWAGTTQGAYFSENPVSKEPVFRPFEAITPYFTTINKIYGDQSGDLWFTTPVYQGIFKLSGEPGQQDATVNYNKAPEKPDQFPTDGAMSMAEGEKGNFFLGTQSGLYQWDLKNNVFKLFNKENGLDANIIYWIEKDDRGNLWLSTERGLVRFNPSLPGERKSKIFTFKDGIPFEEIYPFGFYKSPEGKMFIGGRKGSGNGFYSFHPDSIRENTHIPNIALTTFSVHNKNYPLNEKIISIEGVKLKHNENFFSFEFAALDYADPEKNQYAYYLEGFEETWNYVGNHRFANYTGVPPGHYTFRVRGSNNDGYWNEAGTSLAITILPPPWKTWWAWLLYGLLFIGIIVTILRFYLRRQRLLYALNLEHIESDKLKEIDSMKTRFFSNISHEFRTPLTLILGPLQKMIGRSHGVADKKDLTVMRRNALRLQQLINQLLDISKLEAGKMRLQCSEMNLVEWVRMYVQSFESLARQKKIDFVFESETTEIKCFFDPEKMAQVVNNLLGNAFKFTELGGKIKVTVTPMNPPFPKGVRGIQGTTVHESGRVITPTSGGPKGVISISDTGPGIPPKDLEHIFNRFYQSDDSQSRKHEGTGIGLALVKELVELHHGTITVESAEGKGTAFTIFLPLGKDHLKPEEIKEKPVETPEAEKLPETEQLAVVAETPEETAETSLPILLIVEDNADMRNYIRGFFTGKYKILEAENGQQGFELAINHIPDIIISDVMMPVMDGYALCKKIKTDERTSHIPLILLTARSSGADKIEGLETGADDFVIKPFDGRELQVRVNNLIEQRKRLRDLLFKRIQKSALSAPEDMEANGITSMDEQFLQKLFNTVSVHYHNQEFNVEVCCSESGMSRTQLHRKIKALTGQTAGEFIRTYRLNRAAELLKKKTATVAEICYDVGFSSPSYFTKCFQDQFGKLPSEV